jgi:hypothetical protein
MKTDEDVIESLRQASRAVRPPADPLERLNRRRETKRRRERWVAGGLALALFVAVFGGSLFALRGVWSDDRQTSSGWTPERPLEIETGHYFHLKGTLFGTGDGSRIDQETWWAPDGSGQLRFNTNRPDKYVPYPPEGVYRKGEFPLPNQDDLSLLSTDPKILEDQLRELAERTGDSLWRTILNLLNFERSPHALPELRAALFEVAAGLDGVARVDGAMDPVGREAIVLKWNEVVAAVNDAGEPTQATMRWALFFDPGTHQLMAEAVGFDAPPKPFLILESAIVGSRGAEPSDDELLFPRAPREPELPPQPSPFLP